MRTNAAFDPIPPETDSGAGVRLASAPIFTPELKSVVRVVSPVPAAVKVRLPLLLVVIVPSPPPPRFKLTPDAPRLIVDAPPPILSAVVVELKALTVVADEPNVKVLPVFGFTEREVDVVKVASPVALSAVSDESRVSVSEAELRVKAADPPDESVTAPAPVYELPAAIETPASEVILSAFSVS